MTENSNQHSPIYVFPSGEKVRAETAVELIKWMRLGSFDSQDESMEQYMFRVSERTLLSMQAVVRIDTPENFVADMYKCGLITNIFQAN